MNMDYEYFKRRAKETQHNGATVSQHNYFLSLAASERRVEKAETTLRVIRESCDIMADTIKNLEDVRDKQRTEIDRLKTELIIAYTPESRNDHDL